MVVPRKKPRASGVLHLELLQTRGRYSLAGQLLNKKDAAGTQQRPGRPARGGSGGPAEHAKPQVPRELKVQGVSQTHAHQF